MKPKDFVSFEIDQSPFYGTISSISEDTATIIYLSYGEETKIKRKLEEIILIWRKS